MEKNYKWKLLYEFLKDRYNKPKEMPGYVLYFLFVIIFVGSFGLFYDLFSAEYGVNLEWDDEKIKNIVMNMTNVSLSLVTASIIDLIFITKNSLKRSEDDEEFFTIKRDINILGISFLIIVFLLWILANAIFVNRYMKLIIGIISLIFGYYVWWICNSKNKLLVHTININNLLGNEPENGRNDDLNGDINGFNN
ncbi:hypothetical protein [Flavobacterium sp. FlaQc-30]|uniref:hypothetical protein n=1 Tax=Flavobacterium sp. FlaQc-30 TaxID=3374179 RepID=UPI0037582BC9